MSETVATAEQTSQFFQRVLAHEPDRVEALLYLTNLAHFNFYRMFYPLFTFDDKRRLYGYYAQWFKNKEFFDVDFVKLCIKHSDVNSVVELGGDCGALAGYVHEVRPDIRWTSYEITPHNTPVGYYVEHVLQDELWRSNLDLDADLFLSMHTLEHFSDEEVKHLLDYLVAQKVRYLLFQIPIKPDGQTWKNYYGAHVLTLGSNQIHKLLSPNYRLVAEIPKGKHIYEGWCGFYEHKTS